MNNNHRFLLSMIMTVMIIITTVFVVYRFIPSLLWAGILLMLTYPLYKQWLVMCCKQDTWAALTFTTFVSVVIFLPLLWLISVLVQEAQVFLDFIIHANKEGIAAPEALISLPGIGNEIKHFWLTHFSQPGGLKAYLSEIDLALSSISYYVKIIGVSLVHRSVQVGFTLLSLFFFYRDGEILIKQINNVGVSCLGNRWSHFSDQIPKALRGTVNGTVLVGMAVGLIMGVTYWCLSFPAPTIAGFFTAIAAMIPFVVPIVFIIVAMVIWLSGSLIKAIILLSIGTVVMFIADHFVKPALIGGTTKLHFLAVLFGLLGGVETLGIIGLFLGPLVMVLFMTLWRELQ